MRIYLDSNVFISLIRTEFGWENRALFAEAEQFFGKVNEGGHTLVLSRIFIEESQKIIYLGKDDIISYFESHGINLEFVFPIGDISFSKIAKLGIHSSDAIHAATAIFGKCDCIVTFNKRDFEKVSSLIKILEPKEFI